MKSSIFKLAADKIENEEERFSCCAISSAAATLGGEYSVNQEERLFFQRIFNVRYDTFEEKLDIEFESAPREQKERLKEIRVMALCFAATIIRDERKSFAKSKYNKNRDSS